MKTYKIISDEQSQKRRRNTYGVYVTYLSIPLIVCKKITVLNFEGRKWISCSLIHDLPMVFQIFELFFIAMHFDDNKLFCIIIKVTCIINIMSTRDSFSRNENFLIKSIISFLLFWLLTIIIFHSYRK